MADYGTRRVQPVLDCMNWRFGGCGYRGTPGKEQFKEQLPNFSFMLSLCPH